MATTTDGPRVLNLPRINPGSEDNFVLVHVSSAGRDRRDVKLIGTEGDQVFSLSTEFKEILKQNRSSAISQGEWKTLLLAILFGEDGKDVAEDVEAVAKVDENTLTLIIQKRVEGITSKYGEISLPANEDEEISLFEWCSITAQSREAVQSELQHLRSMLQEKDAQIKRLEASCAELVTLKTENENQLLEKFSLLLNEKKLKIRDQQRLLASSSVDPTKAKAVEDSRTNDQSYAPKTSRKGKRKGGKDAPPLTDEESDDGFEQMDIDEAAKDSEEGAAVETPERSTAEETASEDEGPVKPPARQRTKEPSAEVEAVIPPKRALPFTQKQKQPAKAITPKDESETEDEEL